MRAVAVGAAMLGVSTGAWAATEYVFGAPNSEEQYLIERLNHSRLNPGAEAQKFRDVADAAKTVPAHLDWHLADAYGYYSVNLGVMQQQISALPSTPPLAPSAKLMTMARNHSQWMFANKRQSHAVPPDTTASASILHRVTGVGYNFATIGENIYAFGRSLFYTHASFEVDWGGSPAAPSYGMQNPAGHRVNNHAAANREVGVGLHLGYSGYGATDVGPVIGTVDLGAEVNAPAFVTGVAYYDLNQNQGYDVGEGISGLRVDVAGATQFAFTAPGGGYAVPVPTVNATRDVTFSGLRAESTRPAAIVDKKNVKQDYVPTWQAPVITSSPRIVGLPVTYTFPTTVGATGYEWLVATPTPAATESGGGTAGISSFVTPGFYAVVQSTVKVGAGGSAFHLAHPALEDQWIQLNPTYVPEDAGTISFQSWLRGSSPRQVARLQVSTDDGFNWTDLWNQVGAAAGGANWNPVTVSLAPYAHRLVRLRFAYTVSGDTWNSTLTTNYGWYVDEIAFANVAQLSPTATGSVVAIGPTASFVHQSATEGALVAAARPILSGRAWGYGPAFDATTAAPTGYSAWALEAEAACGLAPGTLVTDPGACPSADGVPAMVRYAVGLASTGRAVNRLPTPEVTPNGLCITYYRDLSRTDVAVALQVSTDYAHWYDAGASGAPVTVSDTAVSVTGTLQKRCAVVSPGPLKSVAARLRVGPG